MDFQIYERYPRNPLQKWEQYIKGVFQKLFLLRYNNSVKLNFHFDMMETLCIEVEVNFLEVKTTLRIHKNIDFSFNFGPLPKVRTIS